MNTDLNIIYKYAGINSILNTVCDDKKIDITDIDSKLVTLEDHSLIIDALRAYEKKARKFGTFPDEQRERLKYLDRYLDIPALALFYSKPDYKLLSRFISNEYDQIPVDLFKSEVVLTDFYKYGSEKELDWMLKVQFVNLDDSLPENLAGFGNLKCLRYVHKRYECPLSDEVLFRAAINGHLNCLQYLHENKCPWDEDTTCWAAMHGHLECLRYLHENKCPWDDSTTFWAACNGHLECLRYAHENGCPLDKCTLYAIVDNGHLNGLRYLHENGCPCDEDTSSAAARHGHLESLRYLHENKCPWDEETTFWAVVNGHLNCLRYAQENGCPINIKVCLENAHENCKEFLLKLKNQK